MFPDNEAGRKAQKFWNERFASVKPQFDYVKKVNELTDGMDIIDILNIDHKVKGPDGKDISISGEQMIDRYGRLMSGDSKINLAKKSALINEYEKYNKNRGYFQLVANKEELMERFGIEEEDYILCGYCLNIVYEE